MKYFVAFAFFAVVCSYVRCEEETSSEELLDKIKSHQLRNYIKESGHVEKATEALDEWCPESSKKLEDALVSVIECTDKKDDSLTTCEYVRTEALNCTRPLIKVVEDCLPQESKELPLVIVKSMISAVDRLCKMDGEGILELANSCVMDIDEDSEDLKKCKEDMTTKAEAMKKNPPTKAQICDLGKTMRSCATNQINKKCTNEKTKKAHTGMLDAVMAPCNDA